MIDDHRLTPLAQRLPATVPFVGPEATERARGRDFRARLGANELVFGPSPTAVAAMQSAAHDAWMYPDPESHDLRHAVAAHHGIRPEHVMIGEGIDTLLGLLVRLFITQGDAVVTSHGAYPTFNYHAAGFGAEIRAVPYQDDHEDIDALLAKARDTDAKLIYLSNPDNPMGSFHSAEALSDMIARIPDGALLILDEAYVELAPQSAQLAQIPDDPRVIRLRTFSKAYGLAGARVGYAIGHPDLISAFNKVRNHFGMSRISQAGALAALADQAYLSDMIDKITASRAAIQQIATDNGLIALPSATNFVTVDCGQDGAFAKRVLDGLIAQDVFVRMPFVAPQNRCIRIGCGTPEMMQIAAKALPDALSTAKLNL